MTYDKATFTFTTPTDTEAAVLTRYIPFEQSDEIDVEIGEIEETIEGFGRLVVTVEGDEYGIGFFEDELPKKAVGASKLDADALEAADTREELDDALGEAAAYYTCDINVGGGDPQPADIRRMEN